MSSPGGKQSKSQHPEYCDRRLTRSCGSAGQPIKLAGILLFSGRLLKSWACGLVARPNLTARRRPVLIEVWFSGCLAFSVFPGRLCFAVVLEIVAEDLFEEYR